MGRDRARFGAGTGRPALFGGRLEPGPGVAQRRRGHAPPLASSIIA